MYSYFALILAVAFNHMCLATPAPEAARNRYKTHIKVFLPELVKTVEHHHTVEKVPVYHEVPVIKEVPIVKEVPVVKHIPLIQTVHIPVVKTVEKPVLVPIPYKDTSMIQYPTWP